MACFACRGLLADAEARYRGLDTHDHTREMLEEMRAARAELARLRECVRLGDVLLEKTVAARDVLTSNSGDCLPMLHGHQADWERTIQAYRAARGIR